jgi:16S rRNA (cytosine1407-C5)-methyltransferase
MNKLSRENKLHIKRRLLIGRTAAAFGVSEDEAEKLLGNRRRQSVRLNPLRYTYRTSVLQAIAAIGYEPISSGLDDDCYFISGDNAALRDSELITNGEAYIQNASSWLPVLALDPQPGETILDMTAAPGGKASHIAARTNNQAELWVNDNSRPRIAKMKANFERMNVRPARIIMHTIESLPKFLEFQAFDKILLDAPCSGEGLIDITNPKMYATWSVAHIKRLQHLQKRAIMNAWQLLRPGGTLVYSTCTIAPEENEAVIDYLLRRQPETKLVALDFELPSRVDAVAAWNGKRFSPALFQCLRLAPHPQFEAFFVAKLRKPFH